MSIIHTATDKTDVSNISASRAISMAEPARRNAGTRVSMVADTSTAILADRAKGSAHAVSTQTGVMVAMARTPGGRARLVAALTGRKEADLAPSQRRIVNTFLDDVARTGLPNIEVRTVPAVPAAVIAAKNSGNALPEGILGAMVTDGIGRNVVLLAKGLSGGQLSETAREEVGEVLASRARSAGVVVAAGDAGARLRMAATRETVLAEDDATFTAQESDTTIVVIDGKATVAQARSGSGTGMTFHEAITILKDNWKKSAAEPGKRGLTHGDDVVSFEDLVKIDDGDTDGYLSGKGGSKRGKVTAEVEAAVKTLMSGQNRRKWEIYSRDGKMDSRELDNALEGEAPEAGDSSPTMTFDDALRVLSGSWRNTREGSWTDYHPVGSLLGTLGSFDEQGLSGGDDIVSMDDLEDIAAGKDTLSNSSIRKVPQVVRDAARDIALYYRDEWKAASGDDKMDGAELSAAMAANPVAPTPAPAPRPVGTGPAIGQTTVDAATGERAHPTGLMPRDTAFRRDGFPLRSRREATIAPDIEKTVVTDTSIGSVALLKPYLGRDTVSTSTATMTTPDGEAVATIKLKYRGGTHETADRTRADFAGLKDLPDEPLAALLALRMAVGGESVSHTHQILKDVGIAVLAAGAAATGVGEVVISAEVLAEAVEAGSIEGLLPYLPEAMQSYAKDHMPAISSYLSAIGSRTKRALSALAGPALTRAVRDHLAEFSSGNRNIENPLADAYVHQATFNTSGSMITSTKIAPGHTRVNTAVQRALVEIGAADLIERMDAGPMELELDLGKRTVSGWVDFLGSFEGKKYLLRKLFKTLDRTDRMDDILGGGLDDWKEARAKDGVAFASDTEARNDQKGFLVALYVNTNTPEAAAPGAAAAFVEEHGHAIAFLEDNGVPEKLGVQPLTVTAAAGGDGDPPRRLTGEQILKLLVDGAQNAFDADPTTGVEARVGGEWVATRVETVGPDDIETFFAPATTIMGDPRLVRQYRLAPVRMRDGTVQYRHVDNDGRITELVATKRDDETGMWVLSPVQRGAAGGGIVRSLRVLNRRLSPAILAAAQGGEPAGPSNAPLPRGRIAIPNLAALERRNLHREASFARRPMRARTGPPPIPDSPRPGPASPLTDTADIQNYLGVALTEAELADLSPEQANETMTRIVGEIFADQRIVEQGPDMTTADIFIGNIRQAVTGDIGTAHRFANMETGDVPSTRGEGPISDLIREFDAAAAILRSPDATNEERIAAASTLVQVASKTRLMSQISSSQYGHWRNSDETVMAEYERGIEIIDEAYGAPLNRVLLELYATGAGPLPGLDATGTMPDMGFFRFYNTMANLPLGDATRMGNLPLLVTMGRAMAHTAGHQRSLYDLGRRYSPDSPMYAEDAPDTVIATRTYGAYGAMTREDIEGLADDAREPVNPRLTGGGIVSYTGHRMTVQDANAAARGNAMAETIDIRMGTGVDMRWSANRENQIMVDGAASDTQVTELVEEEFPMKNGETGVKYEIRSRTRPFEESGTR